jgi:hypothetical protein
MAALKPSSTSIFSASLPTLNYNGQHDMPSTAGKTLWVRTLLATIIYGQPEELFMASTV